MKGKRINKLIDKITGICEELTEIRDVMQDKFDTMSDNRQEGEAGQALENQISKLDDLICNLEFADDARPEEFLKGR